MRPSSLFSFFPGLRHLAACSLVALLLAGCAGPRMTAREAIDEFTAAGLSAPNPQDVTDTACADIGCEEAVATDVVTVFRWGESSQAIVHSDGLQQPAYSLDEFVIAFPVGTDVDTSEYATALQEAVAAR